MRGCAAESDKGSVCAIIDHVTPFDTMSRAVGTDIKRGLVLFTFLMVVYAANGDYLPGNDAKGNLYVAVNLLNHRALSFAPRDFPFMFTWKYKDQAAINKNAPLSELIRSGVVEVDQPSYYLARGAREGVYVSAFGFGSGMVAVPAFALLKLSGRDPASHLAYLWYGGKVVASTLVAASAVLVFLAAAEFCATGSALLIALAYGLGTSVWSISSQTLWQHGANEFFLALGALFLIRSRHRQHTSVLWCGAALASAVLCRATSMAVVLAIGAYLLIVDRRAFPKFVLGGLPFAVALLVYNWHYLGSPFSFGETGAGGAQIALAKTGRPELWQTPLLEGALGLLVSPSRGLFVFSPFLVLGLPSFYRLFRDARFRVLIPLIAGAVGMMLIAFKWFDWWGGWCFGYRPLVDTMPLVILLFIPIISGILARPVLRAIFVLLLLWSIGAQVIGAYAYDLTEWNGGHHRPPLYEVTLGDRTTYLLTANDDRDALRQVRGLEAISLIQKREDIDRPEFRYRLWSVSDSQLIYYFHNFRASRRAKEELIETHLKYP
jgi:hypothetical protein